MKNASNVSRHYARSRRSVNNNRGTSGYAEQAETDVALGVGDAPGGDKDEAYALAGIDKIKVQLK